MLQKVTDRTVSCKTGRSYLGTFSMSVSSLWCLSWTTGMQKLWLQPSSQESVKLQCDLQLCAHHCSVSKFISRWWQWEVYGESSSKWVKCLCPDFPGWTVKNHSMRTEWRVSQGQWNRVCGRAGGVCVFVSWSRKSTRVLSCNYLANLK